MRTRGGGSTNKCPAGQCPPRGDGCVPGGNEQMPPPPEPAPKREGRSGRRGANVPNTIPPPPVPIQERRDRGEGEQEPEEDELSGPYATVKRYTVVALATPVYRGAAARYGSTETRIEGENLPPNTVQRKARSGRYSGPEQI